jgi:hypothetical protein
MNVLRPIKIYGKVKHLNPSNAEHVQSVSSYIYLNLSFTTFVLDHRKLINISFEQKSAS